jgi:hypothetical protein
VRYCCVTKCSVCICVMNHCAHIYTSTHYTTLHYTTLHYTTLHSTPPHCTARFRKGRLAGEIPSGGRMLRVCKKTNQKSERVSMNADVSSHGHLPNDTHTHTHTCANIHAHIHTHTHAHTHTQSFRMCQRCTEHSNPARTIIHRQNTHCTVNTHTQCEHLILTHTHTHTQQTTNLSQLRRVCVCA